MEYYQEDENVAMVILATNETNKKYVIKLIHTPLQSLYREEVQARFSEYMRENRIPIPVKYKINEQFCTEISLDTKTFLVMVEDYFGKSVSYPDMNLALFLGETLAEMHLLSEEAGYRIGKGSTYKAIMSEKAGFNYILKRFPNKYVTDKRMVRISEVHNCMLKELVSCWDRLPIATVHGDLGLGSNLVRNKKGLGIIDFNLSGDEVLLGDLLVTWYSSRYDFDFIMQTDDKEIEGFKNAYFSSYKKKRILKGVEEECFDKISKFLNGTYFCKYISELFLNEYEELADELLNCAYEEYLQLDTKFELKKGILLHGRSNDF